MRGNTSNTGEQHLAVPQHLPQQQLPAQVAFVPELAGQAMFGAAQQQLQSHAAAAPADSAVTPALLAQGGHAAYQQQHLQQQQHHFQQQPQQPHQHQQQPPYQQPQHVAGDDLDMDDEELPSTPPEEGQHQVPGGGAPGAGLIIH